eukprot:1126963-Prorocentrum_minimum.AAC.7
MSRVGNSPVAGPPSLINSWRATLSASSLSCQYNQGPKGGVEGVQRGGYTHPAEALVLVVGNLLQLCVLAQKAVQRAEDALAGVDAQLQARLQAPRA